jgi:predicted RNA-binding protein with PUA-like domain
MSYFLAKTDPDTYNIDQFAQEKQTTWDGITNPQALQAIRAMKKKDRVFVYHSGGQSAIVGLAEVVSSPRADPADAKLWVIDLKFRKRLDPPVTLAEIRAEGRFAAWLLLRQTRLSTMAAPDEFVDWMRQRYPKAGI